MFCNENDLIYPVCVSDKKFENFMDLLLIASENRPHYVYIKDFNRVWQCRVLTEFNSVVRQKIMIIKNTFAEIFYNVLLVKEF